ncbi:MAG TPA: substrate-binding domain-containing protein [Solirubrobacteraceae bacterium]|nr:substrate-binding domain-containing protein [Solirubrobacteraceae bacterium]
MTTLVRRAVFVAATAAALMVAALPGTALAKKGPKTDQLEHCAGSNIEGLGSSFQAPAQKVWEKKFNESANTLACSGTKKPTFIYNQNELPTNNKGSGACLKDFGQGGAGNRRYKEFPLCGTDEAPSKTVKEEMETNDGFVPNKGEEIQSVPIAQGAVAVIVNLPETCTAESEPKLAKTVTKIKRLSLEAKVVEGIFEGSIKTFKEAVEKNLSASDKLTCGVPANAEVPINVVVRLDKSGTTHIFKAFLGQISTAEIEMEEENEPEGAGKGQPCKAIKPAKEKRTWAQVSEGCENQRWPEAAEIVRPGKTGNPGVIEKVDTTPNSISYADLAVAREKKFFDPSGGGGEGTQRFWAPVSNSKPTTKKPEYADPSTNGDVEAVANSNCAKTVYANAVGEKFPPKTTREDWSQVKGLAVTKTYPICGLTYDLAFRLYSTPLVSLVPPITEEETKKIATTVSDYLKFVLDTHTGGGGEEIKGIDYEPLPKKALKVAVAGAAEIGSKEA